MASSSRFRLSLTPLRLGRNQYPQWSAKHKYSAHGIQNLRTGSWIEYRFYCPALVRLLLLELTEPCRTVVQLAVLTGFRIGKILALRWKRLDLLRGTIELAETYSDGEFGSAKTRSSNLVIPVSGLLRSLLESHRGGTNCRAPGDLVFCTPSATPHKLRESCSRMF